MRRILAVTSGRADASPMRPVIEALKGNLCGTAEVGDFGDTWPSVRMSEALIYAAQKIEEHKPDIMLVLGDRYEILAAASAATLVCVPIAHIHGGESSYGSFDNQIRDAVTKLAHIHFVAAGPFRERLLALAEEPERIHVVGAPGLDNLVDLPPRKPGKYFVVTYHPATLSDDAGVDALIEALALFPDYDVMWTGVNNDPGGDDIHRRFSGAFQLNALAPGEYLRFSRNAAAIIGNSSSGIIEAPTLGVPTVNIGPRQEGRLHGPSILCCNESLAEIDWCINRALSYEGPYDNPYGGPGASAKIADILSTIDLDGILVKR